ncbi:precorrin-6y C5,15-methyltransferase (decarboxylating) subunit CbiE [Microvirga pudoricolor]|uniref:precorrin-6y C5,15-methyltransferase (decarboxylating) subunit CbiE n=1 Tax=Microvirga pudoricolor TaxID=2778729 RepID=UPI00194E4564|nr:precorrin-6y C5,15-methyltransferase (decarboxylating) subunit CbiE [Microvirga pudoricolor]MBM6592903.1 precorrin-6y C5,15-methyltransferase (decarboxylating) subunit CbiE [Microvirga pudoricolor]
MAALSPNGSPVSSASQTPWLFIVGIGEDGRAGLSATAIQAIEGAGLVFGGKRHLELAGPFPGEARPWPSPMTDVYPQILAHQGEKVCVLASGDPFHYGIGAELAKLVPAEEISAFPHVSAFSLAAARLGWSLPDCACVSLHGRALERIVPHLQPDARVLALSWDGTTPERLASLLNERGFGGSDITVLEAMGGPRERVLRAQADSFDLGDIDPLNVIAVRIVAAPEAHVVPLASGLDDTWFENDGQLTKAEIRAITLSALAPRAGNLLWDVGAGAGSVSIEWMLRHPANRAIAVEARGDRAERLLRNASHLGVPDVKSIVGKAPDALKDLPRPDAIFIGGGATGDGVIEACWEALKPGGRFVINAVTLETEHVLNTCFARYGGAMRRIAVSRLDPIGSLHGWRPAMPVTQWWATKP